MEQRFTVVEESPSEMKGCLAKRAARLGNAWMKGNPGWKIVSSDLIPNYYHGNQVNPGTEIGAFALLLLVEKYQEDEGQNEEAHS